MINTSPAGTSTTARTSTTATTSTTSRLYLIRGVIALIWAVLLIAAVSSGASLTTPDAVPAFEIALLVIYPLIDLVASLVDARSSRHGASRNVTAQLVNAAISAVAVAGIAVAASDGADAILRVFGAWALLTGLIQLVLAIIRRRSGTPGQLPMILSGSISSLAGIAFILMATKTDVNLINLAGYATAGATFFLVSAWRLRPRSGTQGTRADSPAHD